MSEYHNRRRVPSSFETRLVGLVAIVLAVAFVAACTSLLGVING